MTDEYDSLYGIRRSDLWEIRKSPLHFIEHLNEPKKETAALRFGIAAHMAILEPHKFDETYVQAVDGRTKEGKAQLARLKPGQELLGKPEFDTIRKMYWALQRNPTAVELMSDYYAEQIYQWCDHETGEQCKMKADIVTTYKGKPFLVDYKTTDSCADGHFERSARKYGYHVQAAMYSEGFFANTYQDPGFAFIAQEKTAPYAVRVYFCDPYFIQQGKDEYHRLMQIYHHCKVKDEWPGYPDAELLGE